MINLPFAQNKTYFILGLGMSNRAVIKALQKAGATVLLWDDNVDTRGEFDENLLCHPEKLNWDEISTVVSAPGIPPSHACIKMADSHAIPVICDIDLFAQSDPKSKIIGVTGTNGKSTVTALIHHILNGNGKAQVGGNIGTPVLALKSKMDYTVLELSSYQLDRSPHLKCDVSVLVNITKDHLDWHETMDNYVAAKEKIFRDASHKIIGVDDEYCKSIFERQEGATAITVFDEDLPFKPTDMPRMKGQHNLQNMLVAYAACRVLEIDHEVIIERMKSFEGLAHRQYLARVINGVPYINDSKATNAEAARAALRSFRNILWLAGGVPKAGGLEALQDDLNHVHTAYLYGEAAQDFAKFLSLRGVPVEVCSTMEEALMLAHKAAQDLRGEPTGSPTVLLSPACASFDQFDNFESRGEQFVQKVMDLGDG